MKNFLARFPVVCVVILSGLAAVQLKALDVSLNKLSPPVSLVGEPVTFQATAGSSGACYQFSVASPLAMSTTVVRDFICESDQVQWAPMQEGWYTMRVVARDGATGETATAQQSFEVTSRVGSDRQSVVSATNNPLVFLYSAPACQSGYFTVNFAPVENSDLRTSTPPRACNGFKTENIWIAGLLPDTDYKINHMVWDDYGDPVAASPDQTFRTGTVTAQLQPGTAIKWDTDQMDFGQGVLLEAQLGIAGPVRTGGIVARNLEGTVLWYYDTTVHGNLNYMLRPLRGGNMMVVAPDQIPGGLREIDLAGNTVWETNATAISRRLQALGYGPIGLFHHDAYRLPRGTILALAETEKDIPSANPDQPARHMMGDVIILMDRNFEILWVWDSFQKLDVNRKAILGESYRSAAGSIDPSTEDWTHGNAVEYLGDGNLLYSSRHQDWLIKIDFRDGTGTGDVIWRLGKDGDFTIDSTDAFPWFSHQHDPHFDGTRLWVFDNGNTRYESQGETGNSRGQVYVLDEQAKTAHLELSADLGSYSTALGSAETLENGNYHFTNGILMDGQYIYAQSLEVQPEGLSGTIRYGYQVDSPVYRSFRMRDLYRPGQ